MGGHEMSYNLPIASIVMVSTTMNFFNLEQSLSGQLQNFQSRTIFISLVHFQLNLGLSSKLHGLSLCPKNQTMQMKVSVSFSTLRPSEKNYRSQSRL